MTEHTWLAILTAAVTLACCLLTLLIGLLRSWKNDLDLAIARICSENKADHDDLWKRIYHHYHNGGGAVVVPKLGD
jgi:hypothetical protein